MSNKKIFSIGYHKTCTTSIEEALKELGYTFGGWGNNMKCADIIIKNKPKDKLFNYIEKYDFVSDTPWYWSFKDDEYVFEFLYRNYPDSYFILSERISSEEWFLSLKNHIKTKPIIKPTYSLHYGKKRIESPNKYKEEIKSFYEEYNKYVKEFFKENDNFIKICPENGDGWEKICGLTNDEIPNKPFPFLNRKRN